MRYRAVGTITWDFETDLPYNQAIEMAKRHLCDIPAHDGLKDVRLLLQLDKLKSKAEKVLISEFNLDEVVPYFSNEHIKREYIVNGVSYTVKMNSDRYFVFRNNMSCVGCGLRGSRIFLECHTSDQTPHFNLYGEEEDKLILFTKDHIKAKCFGGEDVLENYQTMCATCNSLKAHSNLTVESVRKLRELYNQHKDSLTKKKLHMLIEAERAKLQVPWEFASAATHDEPPCQDSVRAKMTFKVIENEGELQSKMNPVDGDNVIGIIEEGSYLECILEINDTVYCKVWKDKTVKVQRSLLE
jgi:hypothetical protein